MSETSDSANVPEADLPPAQGPQAPVAEGTVAPPEPPVVEQPSIDTGQWAETELDLEGLQLLTRFLMGAVFMYGDELFERLRFFQQEIDAEPWILDGDKSPITKLAHWQYCDQSPPTNHWIRDRSNDNHPR